MDRNGVVGSAVRVIDKSTFLNAPSDVFFDGDLTLTGWARFNEKLANQTFLDFGVGHERSDTFRLFLADRTLRLCFELDGKIALKSSQNINLHEWVHIALSIQDLSAAIYLNGQAVDRNKLTKKPSSLMRTFNFIGRSNLKGLPVSNADFDEIKIFKRALSEQEIQDEMKGLNAINEI